jgi:hypothetical protein
VHESQTSAAIREFLRLQEHAMRTGAQLGIAIVAAVSGAI